MGLLSFILIYVHDYDQDYYYGCSYYVVTVMQRILKNALFDDDICSYLDFHIYFPLLVIFVPFPFLSSSQYSCFYYFI